MIVQIRYHSSKYKLFIINHKIFNYIYRIKSKVTLYNFYSSMLNRKTRLYFLYSVLFLFYIIRAPPLLSLKSNSKKGVIIDDYI